MEKFSEFSAISSCEFVVSLQQLKCKNKFIHVSVIVVRNVDTMITRNAIILESLKMTFNCAIKTCPHTRRFINNFRQ